MYNGSDSNQGKSVKENSLMPIIPPLQISGADSLKDSQPPICRTTARTRDSRLLEDSIKPFKEGLAVVVFIGFWFLSFGLGEQGVSLLGFLFIEACYYLLPTQSIATKQVLETQSRLIRYS